MVNAYRVERAGSYKIRVDEGTKRITTFQGVKDNFGIDISFSTSTHSDYYTDAHKKEKGVRTVAFRMSDKFWNGLKYLKKFGTSSEQKAGKTWVEQVGAHKLKEPQASDGASLDKSTKKTALHFETGWLPILLTQVVGGATVTYLDEKTEDFPAKLKEEGKDFFMGFATIEQIRENGWSVYLDGWDKTDDDIDNEI